MYDEVVLAAISLLIMLLNLGQLVEAAAKS
jgi:hypothetical protein